MSKILCLGNEFVEGDSLAKEVGKLLSEDFDVVDVKDSYQLMTLLHQEDNPVILDVVKDLQDVRMIPAERIRASSFLSAHDFDAAQVIKLINKPVRIIGMPMQGDAKQVIVQVRNLLSSLL